MRLRVEKERRGLLLRCWSSDYMQGEIAYAVLGWRGPKLTIEFPSDWHEHRRAWITIGLGFLTTAFSFPWKKTVPDDGQCSGPTYGFYFFEDSLVLLYGKTHGRRGDPQKYIRMPWGWKHREHRVESQPMAYSYQYERESGEIQKRSATITKESRIWTRPWLPWKKVCRSINVEFSDEVGEGTGSCKGGTTGCSYEMLPHETPLECLRRMERERRFRR
jgi:hypothetical protein